MNTHICPACTKIQRAGDGFCDQCGTALMLVRYCESCGVPAAHRGEFCRECGTRLPPLPPLEAAPASAASVKPDRLAEPEPKPRSWLDEPEPSPANKPAWLSEPEPAPLPPPIVKPPPASAPVALRPVAAPVPSVAAPATALPMRRSVAAPVPLRQDLLPAPLTGGDHVITLIAVGFGVMGVLLAANALPLAIVFLGLMLVLGGMRLRRTAAAGANRVVDWLWEDPVLRRRMLDE